MFGYILFVAFVYLAWRAYKYSREDPPEDPRGGGGGGPGKDPDDDSGLPPLPPDTYIPSYVPDEWVEENLEVLCRWIPKTTEEGERHDPGVPAPIPERPRAAGG